MKHLLGIEGLTRDDLYRYLNNSKEMIEISSRELKKVPALRGKTVVNLFFENSTRTRTSFELAGKRLSADVVNISSSGSSMSKGETLLDTARNIEAMAPDALIVRHASSGAPAFLAERLHGISVINAGDGMHEHPTQALLDCLTLMLYYGKRPEGIEKLKIAIVGDVLHSRVARSNIWAHLLLGNDICLVGPTPLVPAELELERTFPRGNSNGKLRVCTRLEEGIEGADVVMCLRMQLERMGQYFVPNLEEYSREYGISESKLRRLAPNAVVLHPGPVNRGIEVSSDVVDGERSLVSSQVSHGVAIRMGVLFSLIAGSREEA